MTTRRSFLKGIIAGLVLTALDPIQAMSLSSTGEPILVAVHLTGGNDALNTLVPHQESAYRKARPNLALPSKPLLGVDRGLALHPSLSRLHGRYHQGDVLFVPGIGREDHDRSHFRSSDIWHGAGKPGGDGWIGTLGKRLQSTPVSLGPNVSRAVACPDHPPVGIVGQEPPSFPGTSRMERAWHGMYERWKADHSAARRLKHSARVVEELSAHFEGKMNRVKVRVPFAGDEFGKRFETAYRLLAGGFPSQLVHLSMGKFDTHSAQLAGHARQLGEFDRALDAFLENMKAAGRPVTVLVYSEFGRRVAENFSGGTDHGAGGLAWLVGNGVEGGIKGEYRLEDLRDGDLATTVHYRSIYAAAVTAAFGEHHGRALFAHQCGANSSDSLTSTPSTSRAV